MYNAIKKFNKKLKNNKDKLLNLAIVMFISFSLLNVFLILNFMKILNNNTII